MSFQTKDLNSDTYIETGFVLALNIRTENVSPKEPKLQGYSWGRVTVYLQSAH